LWNNCIYWFSMWLYRN